MGLVSAWSLDGEYIGHKSGWSFLVNPLTSPLSIFLALALQSYKPISGKFITHDSCGWSFLVDPFISPLSIFPALALLS